MPPRSFFSRLIFSPKHTPHQPNPPKNKRPHAPSWRYRLGQFFIIITLTVSAIWLLLAIWYQLGIRSPMTWLATVVIVGLVSALLLTPYWATLTHNLLHKMNNSNKVNNNKVNNNHKPLNHKPPHYKKVTKGLTALYVGVWLLGAGWFMSIEPKQNRDWQPDVSQRLTYERDVTNPQLITLHPVRNFDWHNNEDATEHWETRTIDMSKLSGVDVINSYWMGPLIAHTLVSFRFEDERPLSFSLEIRKEKGESFSAIGGFFKRFELSLIASEERDIIYTRSNARGEQVYLFPVSHLQHSEVKDLFESYLAAADALNDKPAWYNTLTSNCTNIIFYMARIISGERLPWDYRIWVSGWLPNYLYEINMLEANPENNKQRWSMDKWYEQAHINPKVRSFDNQAADSTTNSREFSTQIRQGIPIPPLADSKVTAKTNAASDAED